MATTKKPLDLQPGDRFVLRGEEHEVAAKPFVVPRGSNVQVPYRAMMGGKAVVALAPDVPVPVREAA